MRSIIVFINFGIKIIFTSNIMLFEYYLPLFCHLKNNSIPNEISVYVFSFVKDDFIKMINNSVIHSKVDKFIRYLHNEDNSYHCLNNHHFLLHIYEVPYKKNMDVHQLKNVCLEYFKHNHVIMMFSHYCCENTGIVLKQYNGSNYYTYALRLI